MPNAHAKLSPSAAKRWLHCPGSVHLDVVDHGPRAADEGTAGHKVFELCLLDAKDPKRYVGKKVEGVEVTEELAGWVREALSWVHDYLHEHPKARLASEQRIDIAPVFGLKSTKCDACGGKGRLKDAECEECGGTGEKSPLWGTADVAIVDPSELVIFDLKLGYVEVEAFGNQQLAMYALGYEHAHGHLEFPQIRMVIHQPRVNGANEWVIPTEELHELREAWLPKVREAIDPAAPLRPSEDACKWCRAAPVCPSLREHALAVAKKEFAAVDTLSVEQLSELLQKAPMIKSALKAAELHAMKLLSVGHEVPGWKLVKGRKNRVWSDTKNAIKTMTKLGFDEDQVAPRELVSPAQAEKLLGKTGKKTLAPFITTPEGGPTLAPESDPRETIKGDFEAMTEEACID
jgi:hypothetical protein